ncbi:MAG TPA: thioredoxin domain-containing protein [Micromonosporaceae bacterium]|nr:thioredoxin domain-containing protein [Micromonosporaceae bacterium]
MSSRARQKQAARVVREQMARERRRRRTTWISVAAIAVLLIAGLIGFAVWRSDGSTGYATPAGITDDGGTDSGIVAAGSGPVTVEVYLDFLCPACKQFEAEANPVLDQLVAENRIRLVWHPLGFLDRLSSPPGYSTQAAAAAGCAADEGKLKAFGDALFARQPAEGGPGLSDDEIIEIGGEVGLITPSFAQCVRDGTYRGWVDHVTNEAARRGVTATPTVFVDGVQVNPTGAEIAAAVASR